MANASDDIPGSVRTRLDFPVWYRGFSKSYIAWANAPGDLKIPLLLQGQTLSVAESYLLACPEKLSESQKRFIVRSIAQRAKGPGDQPLLSHGRRPSRWQWRRASDRNLWQLYAVIGLGLWVFSPNIMRDVMERALNPPSVYEELRAQRTAAAAKSKRGAPDLMAPDAASPTAAGTQQADATGQPGTADHKAPLADIDETPHLTFPPRPAVNPSVTLAGLSRDKLDAGHYRIGLLLAIESIDEVIKENPSTPGAIEAPAALLLRAMATRATLAPLAPRSATARTTLFCHDARAVMGVTGDDAISVWWAGANRRPTSIVNTSTTLQGVAADRDCGRILLPNEDFNVELRSLTGAKSTLQLTGHEASILASAFSPDGTAIVTASQDSTARIWDARTGRQRHILSGHDWHVADAQFSPDGRRIVTASSDMTARIWDAATGKTLHILRGHQGVVTGARFTPDATRILTTSWDGTTRLWDAVTGKQMLTLQYPGGIVDADLSRDGQRIATSDSDGGMQLWDAATGEELGSLPGEGDVIRTLTFAPNGRWLIVHSWSGKLALHDAERGTLSMVLSGPEQRVREVKLTDGGRALAGITEDGLRLDWPLTRSGTETLAQAKAIAPSCLSADERSALGLGTEAPAWCAGQPPRGAALP